MKPCKCPDCNVALVEFGPELPDYGFCKSCRNDFSPRHMAKLRTFEGIQLHGTRAAIEDDDGTGWMRLVFISAPSDTPERRLLAFIELTNNAHRFRRDCSCSHDCCGCAFEQHRELMLFDDVYGIWVLKIREGINV